MDTQRFKPLTPETMTPEQKEVADRIVAGPRKGMRGPFSALLRSPELADAAQKLGEYARFKTSIPPRLNELAILLTARHWTAQYEWYAHHRLAMQAGLSPDIAAAIAEGKRPASMAGSHPAWGPRPMRQNRVPDPVPRWPSRDDRQTSLRRLGDLHC